MASEQNTRSLNASWCFTKNIHIAQTTNTKNIHIGIIQETKLQAHQNTPNIPSYSSIRTDRAAAQGGGLIPYIHNDISYKDTRQHTRTLIPQDNTLEIHSLKIATGASTFCNIINIYIPPDTSPEVPAHYIPQLTPLASLPNTIVAGDFNAKCGLYTLDVDCMWTNVDCMWTGTHSIYIILEVSHLQHNLRTCSH
jgi:hypothetical protein